MVMLFLGSFLLPYPLVTDLLDSVVSIQPLNNILHKLRKFIVSFSVVIHMKIQPQYQNPLVNTDCSIQLSNKRNNSFFIYTVLRAIVYLYLFPVIDNPAIIGDCISVSKLVHLTNALTVVFSMPRHPRLSLVSAPFGCWSQDLLRAIRLRYQ